MKINILYIFIIFFYITSSCAGFNPREYDPRLSIKSNKSKLSLEKMKDISWLLKRVKDVNNFIKENPLDRDARVVRIYLLQLLTFYTPNPAYKLRYLEIGMKYLKDDLKYFPDEKGIKFTIISFFSQTFLFKGRVYFLNKARYISEGLEKLIKNDLGCCNGYAVFFLGRYYFKLPSFPISIGNVNKSKQYLEIALKHNPHLITVYLALADTLYGMGKKHEALSLLEKAKKITPITWFELVEYDIYYKGIDIQENWMKDDSWDKIKDVFKEVQHSEE